jgi:putative flippase GtrA
MKFKGRPIRGAIFGFLTFLFIGLDLLFFGIIPLKSAAITVLPIVGIVFGLVWAYFAPLKRRGAGAAPPAM